MASPQQELDGVITSTEVTVQKYKTIQGINKELATLIKVMEEQRGKQKLEAIKAVGKWETARHSGESKAMIEALVDIIALPIGKYPINTQQIVRLQDQARQAATEKDRGRMMWQAFVRETINLDDPQLAGTYDALNDIATFDESFLLGEPGLLERYKKLDAQVKIQKDTLTRAQGLRQAAIGLQADLEAKPNAELADRERMIKSAGLGESNAFQAIQAMVTAADGYTPSPEISTLVEELKTEKKALQGGEEGSEIAPLTDRQWRAKILAKSGVQEHAHSNGFDVGHVEADGRYVDGPDDDEYFDFIDMQRSQGYKEDEVWQKRKFQGERDTYGTVTLKGEAVPAPPPDPNAVAGKLYFLPGDTEPMTKEEVAEGKLTALTPEQLTANGIEVKDAPAYVPPAAPPSTTVSGKRLGLRYGDPEGSVRMLTAEGVKSFTKDQMEGGFTATSGGGQPQGLGTFIERVQGRQAENTERKRADDGGTATQAQRQPAPAEDLARKVVPTYESEADKQKKVDADLVAEQARRAKEQAAKDITDAMPGVPATDEEATQRREMGEARAEGRPETGTKKAVAKELEEMEAFEKDREGKAAPVPAGPPKRAPVEEVLDTNQGDAQDIAEAQIAAWRKKNAAAIKLRAKNDGGVDADAVLRTRADYEGKKRDAGKSWYSEADGRLNPPDDKKDGEKAQAEMTRPDKPSAAKDVTAAPSAGDVPDPEVAAFSFKPEPAEVLKRRLAKMKDVAPEP